VRLTSRTVGQRRPDRFGRVPVAEQFKTDHGSGGLTSVIRIPSDESVVAIIDRARWPRFGYRTASQTRLAAPAAKQ
jgi:hypothetical protein